MNDVNPQRNDLLSKSLDVLLATEASTPVLVARIVAGLPLVGIGLQHAIGSAPLLPIIQGTPLPFPELNAFVGPLLQILGGSLLLVGAFARIGAALGAGAMAVALFSHATFQPYVPAGSTELFLWADEPPIALPIAVLLASLFVAGRGAGRWSLDLQLLGRLGWPTLQAHAAPLTR